jgi:hypothetical protein
MPTLIRTDCSRDRRVARRRLVRAAAGGAEALAVTGAAGFLGVSAAGAWLLAVLTSTDDVMSPHAPS